jgi:16S rRNA (uracil1498-N3)-methyltransferase
VVGRGEEGVISLLARPGELVEGTEIELAEEEAHHLRVRRGTMAELVRLLDGAGVRATASVRIDGKRVLATVGLVEQVSRGPDVTLGVAAGDKDRFALVVEKAAELGVTRLIPLTTERSAAVATRIRSGQLPKLQRRALEAIKQSGAAWAPIVAEPMSLYHFATARYAGRRWLADAQGSVPMALHASEAVTIAIGPEGGFTDDERQTLLDGGFSAVRLGPDILRFETAAIAAMTAAWLLHQQDPHG